MHESVVIRKMDAMDELFEITNNAISDGKTEQAFAYTQGKVKNLVLLLKPYLENPSEMLHSQKAAHIFDSFYELKVKFDAFAKDHFQKSREWYTAALVVSEADGALDEYTLAEHTLRECMKNGMAPWVATCVTNSVLEKDVIKLEDANSAYEALRKSGKIKQ